MRRSAAIGLLIVAMLALFPPVRPVESNRSVQGLGDYFWSARTCLIKADPYQVERRRDDGFTESVSTAIDLPRLTCELLFVASVAGLTALWWSRPQ